MIYFSKRLTNRFALDFSCFHLVRKFGDGITFWEYSVNLDLYKENHNPQFRILWILLNFKIFEFEIYNINHVNEIDQEID